MLSDRKVTIWLALHKWDLLKHIYTLCVLVPSLKVCTAIFQNKLGSWHCVTGCLSADNLYITGRLSDSLNPFWSWFVANDCLQILFRSVMNNSDFFPLSFFLHTPQTRSLLQLAHTAHHTQFAQSCSCYVCTTLKLNQTLTVVWDLKWWDSHPNQIILVITLNFCYV